MREPRRARLSSSLALRKSLPSKMMLPPVMRQPGLAKPMAARPIVDLPAPDSPMRPRTSPRFSVRPTPFTISCHTSSLWPEILRSLISSSTSPLVRLASDFLASLFITQSACLVQEPVDDEIDRDRQERNGARRQERRDITISDERRILAHHRAPVGGRRLDTQA